MIFINIFKGSSGSLYPFLSLPLPPPLPLPLPLVCLRKLDDTENAFVAFERACSLAQGQQGQQGQQGGMRHPLVFLNFALFCYETGRVALATEQYNRFMAHAQDLLLPTEVSRVIYHRAQWLLALVSD